MTPAHEGAPSGYPPADTPPAQTAPTNDTTADQPSTPATPPTELIADPPPRPTTARGLEAAASAAAAASGIETRAQRSRRIAHSVRLYAYAIGAVALVAVLIALAASNTAHVRVDWIVGHSQVSLVWPVLVAAILGWALGLLTSARLHWLTRATRSKRRS